MVRISLLFLGGGEKNLLNHGFIVVCEKIIDIITLSSAG